MLGLAKKLEDLNIRVIYLSFFRLTIKNYCFLNQLTVKNHCLPTLTYICFKFKPLQKVSITSHSWGLTNVYLKEYSAKKIQFELNILLIYDLAINLAQIVFSAEYSFKETWALTSEPYDLFFLLTDDPWPGEFCPVRLRTNTGVVTMWNKITVLWNTQNDTLLTYAVTLYQNQSKIICIKLI